MNPDIRQDPPLSQEFLKQEVLALRAELSRLRHSLHALTLLQSELDQITPQSDPFDLIDRILSTALRAVNCQDGSLMLLDEEKGELVFVHVLGEAQERLKGFRLPATQGIAGWVVANRQPRLAPEAHADSLFSPLVDQSVNFHTLSLMCVPLVDGRRALGAIEAINPTGGVPFTQEDLDILQLVARLATMAIVKAEGAQ